MVKFNSREIGVIYRLTQTLILGYLIGWIMLHEKGYQSTDKAISGVTAKLKGVSYTNFTKFNPQLQDRLYDEADFIIPPQQHSAFFIMTNMVVTLNQTQRICEESSDVFDSLCTRNHGCIPGKLALTGNGVRTGRCINSTRNNNVSVCEIYGWCPTEHDYLDHTSSVLNNAPNFTVFIKNSIQFISYKVKRRNVLAWMTKHFLLTCKHEPDHPQNKYCPIFRLGDILSYSKADAADIWYKGGMVSINIEWDCDLDYSEKYCLPKYSFHRLDESTTPIAAGWNFRHANFYMLNNIEYRNLIKVYGIQFFINVYGTARKFDIYTFTMNIGSGVGLFGVAKVICDIILFNIVKHRAFYRNFVTEVAEEEPHSGAKECNIKAGGSDLKTSS